MNHQFISFLPLGLLIVKSVVSIVPDVPIRSLLPVPLLVTPFT